MNKKITHVLPYGNRQLNLNPVRECLKKAVLYSIIGATALFAAPVVAQNVAAPADTTKATDNKTPAKPIVFAQETFRLDGGVRILKVFAVNTDGNNKGYNFILCNLLHGNETSKWWVAGLLESTESSQQWVVLSKLGEPGKPIGIDNPVVVKYIRGLIEDARNLSPADVRQAAKAVK